MSRGLYIYWKLPRSRVADAQAAVLAFQAAWRQQGVLAELHERADDPGDTATLMETYAAVGGLPAATERALIDGSAAALGRWATGPRHVEVFSRRPP